jgi:hypothetical protein
MKKILLFVNLLLVTLTVVKAQPQYSISATPVTAIGSDYPFNSYPAGSRVQWLFLNTQFPAAPAGFITKVYVKSNTATVNATYTNFAIRIGQTSATTQTATFLTSGMTTALSANPYVVPATAINGWVEFALTTPIPYDNTQNLVVEVSHDGFLNGFNLRHGSTTNRRTYADNPNATGTVDNYMPDFGFDVALPCKKVDYNSIQINNITTTSANISWNNPGISTMAYEYQLDQTVANPPSVGYITTTTPALSFTNLTPGTCYYIHLRTNCDPAMSLPNMDTSGWVVDSFCTQIACSAPEVTIDRISGTTAVATWSAVPTVLSYEYAVGTTPDTPTVGNTTIYTSVKLQGLTPNKPLYFYLKSYCSVVPVSTWATTPFHTEAGTGINDVSTRGSVLSAYPNPVTDVLKLKIDGDKNALLTLTDLTGKILATYTQLAADMTIDMKAMPSGIYILKYSSGADVDVIRVNKQ